MTELLNSLDDESLLICHMPYSEDRRRIYQYLEKHHPELKKGGVLVQGLHKQCATLLRCCEWTVVDKYFDDERFGIGTCGKCGRCVCTDDPCVDKIYKDRNNVVVIRKKAINWTDCRRPETEYNIGRLYFDTLLSEAKIVKGPGGGD